MPRMLKRPAEFGVFVDVEFHDLQLAVCRPSQSQPRSAPASGRGGTNSRPEINHHWLGLEPVDHFSLERAVRNAIYRICHEYLFPIEVLPEPFAFLPGLD